MGSTRKHIMPSHDMYEIALGDLLDLTPSQLATLARVGIETLGELQDRWSDYLLSIQGIGRVTVASIRYQLQEMDLDLCHQDSDDDEVEAAQHPAHIRYARRFGARDRAIWLARHEGRKLQSIADEYGIHNTRVCQIVQAWDRKFRRFALSTKVAGRSVA